MWFNTYQRLNDSTVFFGKLPIMLLENVGGRPFIRIGDTFDKSGVDLGLPLGLRLKSKGILGDVLTVIIYAIIIYYAY